MLVLHRVGCSFLFFRALAYRLPCALSGSDNVSSGDAVACWNVFPPNCDFKINRKCCQTVRAQWKTFRGSSWTRCRSRQSIFMSTALPLRPSVRLMLTTWTGSIQKLSVSAVAYFVIGWPTENKLRMWSPGLAGGQHRLDLGGPQTRNNSPLLRDFLPIGPSVICWCAAGRESAKHSGCPKDASPFRERAVSCSRGQGR
jgi:hypothetical protein